MYRITCTLCVLCLPSLLLCLCYKLLENPGFVREKNARQKVIFLVGTLIKRYSMGLSKRWEWVWLWALMGVVLGNDGCGFDEASLIKTRSKVA